MVKLEITAVATVAYATALQRCGLKAGFLQDRTRICDDCFQNET